MTDIQITDGRDCKDEWQIGRKDGTLNGRTGVRNGGWIEERMDGKIEETKDRRKDG